MCPHLSRIGTRSGLWSHMAHAIDVLRPQLVVIENVGGLFSAEASSVVESHPWCLGDDGSGEHAVLLRAIDAVLSTLSELGYGAEWTALRAADVGAPMAASEFSSLPTPRASRGASHTETVAMLPTPTAVYSGNTAEEHLRKKPGRTKITDLRVLVEERGL